MAPKRKRPPGSLSDARGRFSPTLHRAVAALVRARRQGEEGVEDAGDGADSTQRIREAVESRADASPFKWVEEEDPRAPFRWLDPVAGPARASFLLLKEAAFRPCHRLATAENLAVCAEVVLRRQLQAEQRGSTAAPYLGQRLAAQAQQALLAAFLESEEETRARVRLAVAPLWEDALALLPKFRHGGRLYVTTTYRSIHDALLARFLRRETFFRVPHVEFRGTEEQVAAAQSILQHLRSRGWAVLAGCGGAGKTFLLAQLASALVEARVPNELRSLDLCPLCECLLVGAACPCGFRRPSGEERPVNVAFSAPTNRAVAVLQRALGATGASQPIATLHSLTLSRHVSPLDLLVVDESSMLDAEHGDLLVGCPALRNAAVLFVGDDLQLPPVGRGELLRPLLARAGLPMLTTNLRAEGAELRACVEGVRRGSASAAAVFARPPAADPERLALVFASAGRNARVLAMRNEERLAYCAHAIRALRPIEDARDEFARQAPSARVFVPFVGEPVRFLTNDQKPAACKGALGTVRRAEETPSGAWDLEVEVPDGLVKIAVPQLRSLGDLLRPAYAITVHDAQGGEFEEVHVLLPPRANCPLCTLEMLYTATSRATRRLALWPQASFEDYAQQFSARVEARLTPLATRHSSE